MPTADATVLSRAQEILDGPSGEEARRACSERRWTAYVRERAPPAPRLFGRRDHAKCVERAAAMFEGPETVTLELVPAWSGTSFEEPDRSWYGGVVMVDPKGRPYSFDEEDADLSPTLSQRLSCRARRWRGGLVTASKYFAPDVPLELRAGDFAVVEQVFYELESAEEISGDPVARPTRDIPAFCTWFEPAVSGLPADLARAVRRASITVDDEGRMIEDGYTG